MAGYSTSEVAEILGWPTSRIYSFVQSAIVDPVRDGRTLLFGFRDLVVLRGAQALLERDVSPARVREALAQLKRTLPAGQPLSAARLEASGGRVAVREHGLLWELGTGQATFDFGYRDVARNKTARITPRELDADDWFDLGVDDEADDEQLALENYGKALALDPQHADALVNVGRIHQARGDLATAADHYARALAAEPAHLIARFNLATVLEAEGRSVEAIATYRAIADQLPDARYNLARLLDRSGDRAGAIGELKKMLRDRPRR